MIFFHVYDEDCCEHCSVDGCAVDCFCTEGVPANGQ